jgi:hypothetical protein
LNLLVVDIQIFALPADDKAFQRTINFPWPIDTWGFVAESSPVKGMPSISIKCCLGICMPINFAIEGMISTTPGLPVLK